MSEDVFEDLWKLMAEEDTVDTIQPGEITMEMYAKMIHASPATAKRALESRVKSGDLTRRQVKVNGKRAWAYRPVVKKARKNDT